MRKVPDKDQNPLRALGLVSVIGLDLAISVLLGFWLGKWLDDRFGTDPIFLIIGILTGLAVGIFMVVKIIQRYTEDNSNG